jgi:hypothetical protein
MPNSVENFAAKTAGKAARLRARARGLTGVFQLLAQQHKEAASMLKRAKQASEPEQRREHWLEVRRELICHERAELVTVYPVLHENEKLAAAGIEREHADDAEKLEAAMSRVDTAGFETSRWPDLLEDLIQLVERHAEQEENDFFPRAQEAIGKDAAAALEGPFQAARAQCLSPLG